jgi:hypothetical protein
MTPARQIELMLSLHKRVDVNALSDDDWREYQRERQEMEDALRTTNNNYGTERKLKETP